jgi:hypothetical protein
MYLILSDLNGGEHMDTDDIIRRYRQRQAEIIGCLAPELLAEYKRLEELIQFIGRIADEERTNFKLPPPPLPDDFFADLPRVPLLTHKRKLIDFLRKSKSPVSRKQILAATTIPAGSLSSILKDDEFEQVEHGLWKLKEK